MRQFSKVTFLVLGTCLFMSACAKNKSKRQVARPQQGTAGVNSAPLAPPGLDEREAKVETQREEVRPVRTTMIPAERESVAQQQVRNNEEGIIQTASESVVPTEPSVGGGARNEECGTAYRANTELWFPGLPYAPSSARICTGGGGEISPDQMYKCDAGKGYVFTDGRQDGLMALVVDNFNKLPKYMDAGSRKLARRIQDVQVDSNLIKVGSVNIRLALFAGRENGHVRYNHIELRGNMSKNGGRVKLRAVNNGRVAAYAGELTCADTNGSCENAILRVDQIATAANPLPVKKGRAKSKAHHAPKKSGIVAVAFVIIRSGDAHVTMSDRERTGFKSISNPSHARFAQYLSNTVNNTCLNIMYDLKHGKRQIPACAYQRLQMECGGHKYQKPAAQDFNLRSWAVAYGRAGFEFEIRDGAQEARLMIKGPLVATSAKPMWTRPLRVSGLLAKHIQGAMLVANDGGGNLNFQLDFNGQDKAQTRISVTSLSEDVRFSAEPRVASQAQVPTVDEKALADERDVREMQSAQQAPAAGQAPAQDEEQLQMAPPTGSEQQVMKPLTEPAPQEAAPQTQQLQSAVPAPGPVMAPQGPVPGAND